MPWPRLALAAGLGLLLSPAFGQAVPKTFPQGEIVVHLHSVGFTARDVIAATPVSDAYGFGVLVQLDPSLDQALADLTEGKTGYWLELYLCGHLLLNARLAEELTEATFRVTATDAGAADALAKAFLAPPCALQMS